MNTTRTWNKITITEILSMGLIVLGILCVCWAAIHIWNQTVTPVDDRQTKSIPWAAKNSIGHQSYFYERQPKTGDEIGSLSIPTLNQNWPIIEGTEEEELAKGVGHFSQSVLPGLPDNCVLSGHRDTVFSEIWKLKLKDKLIVETSAGIFTYEISNIRIVDKDDRTVIVPTDHAVLTITTCYPFNFVGSAPKRYILVADLVRNE
jgi:sortase A